MERHGAVIVEDGAATAARLLGIVNGSWMSQAAYAAASLRIPDLLAERAKSAEELAREAGVHAPSLRRLLRALVTLEICRESREELYEVTPMGALLRTDQPDSLRSWTLYWGGPQWPVWGNLLHSVTTGESARMLVTGSDGFERLETDPEAAALFNQAMVELTRLDTADIVRACDFSASERIIDVGGGFGGLLAAILQANPDKRGVLFDRPHAMEGARELMKVARLADRCEFIAGDFFETIPGGADAYLLKSVIHDWNDERSVVILRNCRCAMKGAAKLLLVERIVPRRLDASAAHRSIARGDLNMLVGLGGRERTEDEYRSLLGAAGLNVNAIVPAGRTFGVIEAVPAS
jgi:orsellinic acid C2-O-methyltransferase